MEIETYTVDESGVRNLNSNLSDKLAIGHRTVRRLSEIEWCAESQEWKVRAVIREHRQDVCEDVHITRVLSRALYSHPSYANCVDWEHMNQDLLENYYDG